jgi:hypothetical protein
MRNVFVGFAVTILLAFALAWVLYVTLVLLLI